MVADRRTPPQGGLPPTAGLAGVVEIACDESGFSGTNLLDAATPVFAHASVDLRPDEAADLVAGLRSGFRRSDEVKSGRFLRGAHVDEGLAWLLDALSGRAHVHLIDKQHFVASRVVDLFLAEPTYAAGTSLAEGSGVSALALYRAGREVGPRWDRFLQAFVALVRTKRRRQPSRGAVQQFIQARDDLAGSGPGAEAEHVLAAIDPAHVWDVLTRLAQRDPSIPPPLEPLLPALAETVLFWSGVHRQVLVIHDEQSALTPGRLQRLQQVLAQGREVSPLAGLVSVDSRDDPRVQVADLLAGVARRSAGRTCMITGGGQRPDAAAGHGYTTWNSIR
ncbi:hypothetical protein [Angustibacter luteus]|uniref:DUF3800 domain-containing protein n=1 Tax=Angustibacter luteus TaxID=658456 RepID=A0ABW1JCH1_9ACTN